MTGAQVLAIAGILSALAVMLGGLVDQPTLVGIGGGIMFFGNLVTLGVERINRDRKPQRPG